MTLVQTEPKKIYMWVEEQTPYTPTSDTVYYFPFISNADDYSGNGYTLSNAGTQETVGRSFTSTTSINKLATNAKFACLRIRIDTRGSGGSGGSLNTYIQPALSSVNGAQMNYCPYNDWNQNNDVVQGWYGSGSAVYRKVNSTVGQWFHLAMYYDSGNFYMYVNGVKSTIGSGTPGFTRGGSDLITIPSGQTAKYTVSDIIVESKIWTDQEVLDYYNANKATYGL